MLEKFNDNFVFPTLTKFQILACVSILICLCKVLRSDEEEHVGLGLQMALCALLRAPPPKVHGSPTLVQLWGFGTPLSFFLNSSGCTNWDLPQATLNKGVLIVGMLCMGTQQTLGA